MRVLVMTFMLFVVAGCNATADRTVTEYKKVNKVDFVRFDHEVMYRNGEARPSAAEEERLNTFLQNIQAGSGDTVLVAGGSPEQRKVLGAHLAYNRLEVQEAAANGAPGRVRVVVERYVVTPPTCPDWSKPVGEDSQNSPGANFGCANTANLGMMVANPGDLLRGRNPGPADGTAVSAGIKRYRDGKVRELLEDDRVTAFTGN
jgi:pilus assembly protein CpaD